MEAGRREENIYQILEKLVDLYDRTKMPVKSKDLAKELGVHEGYIRNIMAVLRSMGLVTSKAGPYGGYVPTQKTYDMLKRKTTVIPIYSQSGEQIGYVIDIDVIGVTVDSAKVIAKVVGDLSNYVNTRIRIGPAPNGLVAIGKLVRFAGNEAVLDDVSMVIVPRVPVGDIMNRNVVTARPDDPVSKYLKHFMEQKIRGVPVVDDQGRPVGLLMASSVLKLLVDGEDLDRVRVEEAMVEDVVTINENDMLMDAIRVMSEKGVGRLIVVNDEGRLVGIVTRTDVLRAIALMWQS